MSAPAAAEDGKRAPPPDAATGGMWAPAGFSWSLFEFARNPYYFLVVIYVFPPYFASAVVGDAVRGQALIAGSIELAGYICAITAPLLGAMMDRSGKRKPVLAVFIGLLALCSATLWFAEPGGAGLPIALIVPLLSLGYVAYTYSEVMHNAMLPLAGRPSSLSAISGFGLSLGQAGAVVGLLAIVVLSVAPGLVGLPEGRMDLIARGIGPVTAVWLVVLMVPFFLYMPDGAPAGGSWRRAGRDILLGGASGNVFSRAGVFIRYIRDLFKQHPQAMRFLIVRMIYADGVTTLLSLGGVYTAGVLAWGQTELALYGIWGSFFGIIGGFFGGSFMDKVFGPRRAIIVELVLLSLGVLTAISVSQESILFGLIRADYAVNGLPFFSQLYEVAYLGAIAFVAVFATAIISSSRYMLVRVAPAGRVSEFFGLYMMAATATVWLGPLLVRLATTASGDQRIGFAPVPALLITGAVLMLLLVRSPPGERNAR